MSPTRSLLRPDRRRLLIGGGVCLLGGCSNARYSALGAAAGDLWADIRDPEITDEQAARVPYATLAVRADGSGERLAVLAEAREGTLTWRIGKDVTLLTTGGRIVGWYDQIAVMIARHDGMHDPIAVDRILPPPNECVRQLDFPDERQYGVTLRSTFADDGPRSVTSETGPRTMRRWLERGSAASLGWAFENEFYCDEANGRFVASTQAIHPDRPMVALRILRPYQAPDQGSSA